MDQTVINLMLSNVDASPEESASETTSIIDGFELMDTQCEGNCHQKLKYLLQEAGKIIKLKDQQIESKDRQIELKDSQIDNHVRAISTLSMKCLDIQNHYLENQMAEKNKTQNSLETLKEKLKDQLADQTKAREDQLNALLEESNQKVENLFAQLSEAESKLKDANALLDESKEKVRMLEIEKQQMENNLPTKINENEVLIKNYETKMNKPVNKEFKSVIYLPKFIMNNDIAGPGWIVIRRFGRQNGSVSKTTDVDLYWVYQLTKDHPHELYIYIENRDGSTSFAHYDDFALHESDGSVYNIKSMGAVRTSMTVLGDFRGKYFASIYDSFRISECSLCNIMVRQKFKYELPRLTTE